MESRSVVSARVSRGSPSAFFSLTILLTWAFWFLASAFPGRADTASFPRPGVPTFLFYLGVFSPAFVAIGLTAREGGRQGVQTLLGQLFEVRVALRWYVYAIGYMASIKLVAAVLHRLFRGEWPPFGVLPWYAMLAATVFSTLVGGQSGEEVGWRGYALPTLASRIGLGPASVLLGIVWAAWHLPLFFLPGAETTGASFPLYLIQVTALSVAIAWLYENTNRSLLLTMLMHAAINNTTNIVPSLVEKAPANPFGLGVSSIGWTTAALLWIPAGYFLVRMRGIRRRNSWASPAEVSHSGQNEP